MTAVTESVVVFYYSWLRGALFALHGILVVLLVVLWVYEWGFTRSTKTFSEIIEHDYTVKVLFVVWLTVYAVACVGVGVFLLEDDVVAHVHIHRDTDDKKASHDDDEDDSPTRDPDTNARDAKVVLVCTVLYGVSECAKIALLYSVAAVDVDDDPDAHYALAGLAFCFAVLCVFFMVVRRGYSQNPNYVCTETLDRHLQLTSRGVGCVSTQGRRFTLTWLYICNILWFIGVLAVAIVFAVGRGGPVEFALATCVLLDRFWQLLDVHMYFAATESYHPIKMIVGYHSKPPPSHAYISCYELHHRM